MGGRSGRAGREGGDVWGCGEWGATPPSIQMMALGGATATALAASSNSAAAVHILLRIRADLPACRLAQYIPFGLPLRAVLERVYQATTSSEHQFICGMHGCTRTRTRRPCCYTC